MIGAEILVGADLGGVVRQIVQIHQTISAQRTHAVFEGVQFIAIRNDAQTAVRRELRLSLFANVSFGGQQRSYTKISRLNIVLLQITEEKLVVDAHKCLHT